MGEIKCDYSALLSNLKKLLSSRKAGKLIVLSIIGARILQLLFLFNTRNDITYQILAAQNLYQGHGLTISQINETDLSCINYVPLNQWPPGFSLLFLFLYPLFQQNYTYTALALGIAAAVGLILFSKKILKLFNLPLYLIHFYLLFSGLNVFYFYLKPCSDAIAISFFIAGLYYTLALIKKPTSFMNVFLLTICLLFCASLKYMYIPLVLILPGYLVLNGSMNKERLLVRNGIISSVFLLLPIIAFFMYQKNTIGAIGYIKQPDRGFYPDHLLSMHPFIPAALIKPETLSIVFNSNLQPFNLVYRFVHFPILLALIVYASCTLFNIKSTFSKKALHLCLWLIVGVTLLLCSLSLSVGYEDTEYGKWTYVEEPRYFGVLHVLIPLALIIAYYYRKKIADNLTKLFAFFLLLFIPEMFRGAIFTFNRLRNLPSEEYGWQQELRLQKFADRLIKKEASHYPGTAVVLTGSSDWYNLRTALYSGIPVFENIKLINRPEKLKSKKPVLLIVQLRQKQVSEYSAFIQYKETKFLSTHEGFYYYSLYIHPKEL